MSVTKALLSSLVIGSIALCAAMRAPCDAPITAISKPSADVTLSFVQVGRDS
jgi:hypothetical protein